MTDQDVRAGNARDVEQRVQLLDHVLGGTRLRHRRAAPGQRRAGDVAHRSRPVVGTDPVRPRQRREHRRPDRRREQAQQIGVHPHIGRVVIAGHQDDGRTAGGAGPPAAEIDLPSPDVDAPENPPLEPSAACGAAVAETDHATVTATNTTATTERGTRPIADATPRPWRRLPRQSQLGRKSDLPIHFVKLRVATFAVPPRAWMSWSSGKDSAYALHRGARTSAPSMFAACS